MTDNNFQTQSICNCLGRSACTFKVAAVDCRGLPVAATEARGNSIGLLVSFGIQRDIRVTLHAKFAIPCGYTVPY